MLYNYIIMYIIYWVIIACRSTYNMNSGIEGTLTNYVIAFILYLL